MPLSDDLGPLATEQQQAGALRGEQAPSLAPWGPLSARIARLIKHTPELAGRLLCAPRPAFHAAAIYLHHHPHQADMEAGTALLDLSPVALVSRCFEPAPGYMAALKKCGASVHDSRFYGELNHLLLSPMADEIASEKHLTTRLLAFFNETRDLDPLVLPARHGLRLEPRNARYFDAMVKFCRTLGVIWDYEAEAKVVRHAAKYGLGRYLNKRLERCVSPWSFELPAPLRQIKTANELVEIASKQGNCLGLVRFRVQLGLGSHIYVIGDEPLNCIVELRRENDALWTIAECEHLETREKLTREVREKVCGLLQQAGLNVMFAAFDELWADIEHFYSPEPLNLYGE
jgi:hypothetical protein